MRLRQLLPAALVALLGLAALAPVGSLIPRGHATRAAPDSYLCVYSTTQHAGGQTVTTPTVCVPWI